jgi:hypothetical protein
MAKARKLLTSKEASQELDISRNALRLLRLQGQLSTIEVNDEGKSAPAGGFWYDAGEIKELKRARQQIRKLQEKMRRK